MGAGASAYERTGSRGHGNAAEPIDQHLDFGHACMDKRCQTPTINFRAISHVFGGNFWIIFACGFEKSKIELSARDTFRADGHALPPQLDLEQRGRAARVALDVDRLRRGRAGRGQGSEEQGVEVPHACMANNKSDRAPSSATLSKVLGPRQF